MGATQLKQEFLDYFKISEYEQASNPGGQKSVYIVTINKVKYALKIINFAGKRFEREVKICNKYSKNIGIPNIINIEEYENDTIILEEYIEGNDLSNVKERYKGNDEKILNLIFSIGTILKPVWEGKYVHRDLKPQNIRIKENGEPVVLDFGIARAIDEESYTATGAMQPKSWLFASPEQYNNDKELISYRTDFFCLGILSYYLYTNELPFGNNKDEISISFEVNNLKVKTGNVRIDQFCNLVLKKNPSERPRKIEKFLENLMT